MKVIVILVAVVGLGWSVTVRGEEQSLPAGHQHQATATVNLERACGSCHGGTSFMTIGHADPEHQQIHLRLLNAAQVVRDAQKRAETVKAPFLGIGVEKPTEPLRAQLGLQEGVGLVVNFVEENSPAKGAGVRQHDVLQKLDDQWLVNEEQLVTLVRLRKAGEPVTLEVIRAGKARNVTVRLGEKDVAAAPFELSPLSTYVDVANGGTMLLGSTATMRPTEGADVRSSLLASYTEVLGGSVTVGPITVDDGSHVIIYTPKDGGVLVAMEKGSGTILFNGPVATDEQWRAVPEMVKEKMQELHESFRRGTEKLAKKVGEKK